MDDYISRQALLRDIEKYHLSDGKFQHWVEVQLSADAIEVVRCKDCYHYDEESEKCILNNSEFKPMDYCSYGSK